jgi:hypothetical protein
MGNRDPNWVKCGPPDCFPDVLRAEVARRLPWISSVASVDWPSARVSVPTARAEGRPDRRCMGFGRRVGGWMRNSALLEPLQVLFVRWCRMPAWLHLTPPFTISSCFNVAFLDERNAAGSRFQHATALVDLRKDGTTVRTTTRSCPITRTMIPQTPSSLSSSGWVQRLLDHHYCTRAALHGVDGDWRLLFAGSWGL